MFLNNSQSSQGNTSVEVSFRSIRSQMFLRIIVLKSFSNYTGKHLCQSLFNKVAGTQNCNFIKKRLQHRCFSVKFAQLLRKPFLTEHLYWLRLGDLGFQPETSVKERLMQRCFPVKFAKFLKTSFDRTPADVVFICEFWEIFQTTFSRTFRGSWLYHVQVKKLQPTDTLKNYVLCSFQVFYRRTRNYHSKRFI